VKFNIFRNPFIYKYVQGWQEGFDAGYEQANQEMKESHDIQYWIGYHNGINERLN
jgi:flagellar biosynthesis/type III secretory pathway protein FliH